MREAAPLGSRLRAAPITYMSGLPIDGARLLAFSLGEAIDWL